MAPPTKKPPPTSDDDSSPKFARSGDNTFTLPPSASTLPKPHTRTSHLTIIPNNPSQRTLLLTSQIGLDPSANKILHPGTIAQMRQIMRNISAALASQGLGMENIVRRRIYLVDRKDLVGIERVWSEFVLEPYPVGMVLIVGEGGLVNDEAKVEVEVDAVG